MTQNLEPWKTTKRVTVSTSEMGDPDLNARDQSEWLDAPSQETDEVEVSDYDIVSSPNDWNFATIVSFIESGAMKIPTFQRNYVWDRKRASKLIESLLIGLPVPQVFLYEEGRNSFLVIDGQQRLLSLYFFSKGRFPRPSVRGEIREHLQHGYLDENLLEDDKYFEPFKLSLAKTASGHPNRFHGLTYKSLKEDKTFLDLRTIRNTVVKQTSPKGNSAVFEIFSRLNTGGVNLTPQEIRASLFHSDFYTAVIALNSHPDWRRILGTSKLDTRMRDTEFLLRSIALAEADSGFSGSMANFLNRFCFESRSIDSRTADERLGSITQFLEMFGQITPPFTRGGKFSGVLFESAYAAWVALDRPAISPSDMTDAVNAAKASEEFAETLQEGSTKPRNVRERINVLKRAMEPFK